MQPIKFKLDMRFLTAKNACGPGTHQATELFSFDKEYSLAEVEAAGLDNRSLLWLVLRHAEDNPKVLSMIRRWALNCASEAGVEGRKIRDYKACVSLVCDAMKHRIRCGMRVSDARAWSHSRLIETFSEG